MLKDRKLGDLIEIREYDGSVINSFRYIDLLDWFYEYRDHDYKDLIRPPKMTTIERLEYIRDNNLCEQFNKTFNSLTNRFGRVGVDLVAYMTVETFFDTI